MDDRLNEQKNELDAQSENELKRIKLSLEHGMDFSQSYTSPSLPPETEGQFLDYIQQWEDQFAQRKVTTVFERAGQPSFRSVAEIPDEDMGIALDECLKVLERNAIRLETLCAVNDRDLYRFITEELLKVEIDDIRIEGMVHSFIYEEFHPNHPYDIKRRCDELIEYIADREKDASTIPWCVADQVISCDKVYTKGELNEHIVCFRELFQSIKLSDCNYLSITLNEAEDHATAIAFVRYSAIVSDMQEVTIEGNCTFKLKCEYGWWSISAFDTPWKML